MKDWRMIHKIKAMYDEGHGSSIRAIARELKVSRNTVKKYLQMDTDQISANLNKRERLKILDQYRDHIIQLLQKYPELSAVKVKRKLTSQGCPVQVSDRSMRRYVRQLKSNVIIKQKRYYEPVLDMLPGVQCQVDLGELRDVRIGENIKTIYFGVFVLSYSRKLFVSLSEHPVNTERFIMMHDEAFTFFEGRPEECVYDQTKLVALKEEFREVLYNERFYQYATTAGFDIRICEGYDPESKGRVEAGVKYVKRDFFYGDDFKSSEDLQKALNRWVADIANQRTHGTTFEVPEVVWENRERRMLKPYLQPSMELFHPKGEFRKVDKTSLISFKSVRYSVPMIFQSSRVIVKEAENELIIFSPETGEEIARHAVCRQKGKTVKNNNHYRDYQKDISAYEKTITDMLGAALGETLCRQLKAGFPKNYKDQLMGLRKILRPYLNKADLCTPLGAISERAGLRVSFIKDYLEAYYGGPRETVYDFENLGAYMTGDLSAYSRLTVAG